ncbi:MAG TPA: aminotransferase class I/II-fold pyridoxal phosphate-dependent enzyme [Thermoanaerobaculia bacterium]|jgi:glutamate/tyrosine decarboxylase-like PLP-dependent enzyme|nr:aminotransferase class I/II-fold pyridoxal phosphate-dependent enzyme [Thermoanaerobaculia bacterium]
MTEGRFALERAGLDALRAALDRLDEGFAELPALEGAGDGEAAALRRVLLETAARLTDNYPYFHPLYAGQMLKPPDPVARLAYALATWINPNNHALDGGRASSAMEKEAVGELARMVGWDEHLGHLCGGGTMANLEALWAAGRLAPGKTVLASSQAHYTHARISAVLGLPFEEIAADRLGRIDAEALERRLERGGVGTVVATLGTTATGSVDPLPGILRLRERHGFRLHVDAAYGGYFRLAENLDAPARRAFDAIGEADSIVVDPHKHGLQPYGCGCVLFRDPSVGRLYRHDSPYTYFSSSELHLGEISLECSRPGASAVALWATMRMLPLERGGAFARRLEDSRAAALDLHARLAKDRRFVPAFRPELDIVVWLVRDASLTACSARARRVFAAAARRNLHLALADLPAAFFDLDAAGIARDGDTVTCLRSVLMKPEHRAWVGAIWDALDAAAGA